MQKSLETELYLPFFQFYYQHSLMELTFPASDFGDSTVWGSAMAQHPEAKTSVCGATVAAQHPRMYKPDATQQA